MEKKKRNTMILLVAICFIALLTVILQKTILQKDGSAAVVQVNGEVTARLDLNQDTELEVGDEENGYNIIEVEDGYVSVTEANCPDKVCVDTGKIKDMGGVIACLPHKLIITVEGESEEEKIDGMTW